MLNLKIAVNNTGYSVTFTMKSDHKLIMNVSSHTVLHKFTTLNIKDISIRLKDFQSSDSSILLKAPTGPLRRVKLDLSVCSSKMFIHQFADNKTLPTH